MLDCQPRPCLTVQHDRVRRQPRDSVKFSDIRPEATAMTIALRLLAIAFLFAVPLSTRADALTVVGDVEGQPLAANVERLARALEFLGAPLPAATAKELVA